MALTFTVKIGPWSAEGYGPFVDEVTVEEPDAELVRLAAHAHDAGVLEVTEGLDESHVQSQEDGEAAHEAAQGSWVERVWNPDGTATPGYWSGGWQIGNAAQHDLEQAQERVVLAREGDDADELAAAEANLAQVDAEIQERLVQA